MGKANKVKLELRDAIEMVDLIQTLKDIADNKFYILMQQKDKFRRFGESFVEFFRMISFSEVKHPMISNENPVTGILIISAEGSFLGAFNNKIFRKALDDKEKYGQVKYIAVGEKAQERFQPVEKDLKSFLDAENVGLYETAVAVKDYLVEEIMNDRMGKVVIYYAYPKSLESQSTKTFKLLPCDELVTKQAQFVEKFENIIEESDPSNIIGYLSNIWITTRIYEILMDTILAATAAQAKFLEDSVDKMKKERDKTKIKFRKAKKGDIDKSLRETFSARMMTQ